MSVISKQVILVSRPTGEPKLSDFKLIETELPALQDGEVLLKTLYFSLDPYMRSRMNSTKGSYVECFKLNVPLDGAAISVVAESKSEELKVGDIVLNATGWQTHAICKGKASAGMAMTSGALTRLPADVKPSLFLGALGMPGLTAHYGLLDIGQPKSGETVVVSAATGAVGGSEKCQYAVRELGYDACVDYKSKTFADDLRKACPNKIDIYFENVGGAVFKAVLPLLNNFARVPVCGLISYYNDGSTLQEPGFKLSGIFSKLKAFIHMFFHLDQTPLLFGSMLGKRIKFQGFIISDHFDDYAAFINETVPLVQAGKIKTKEDIVKGIENSPAAFIKLLQGKNFGKLVIEV